MLYSLLFIICACTVDDTSGSTCFVLLVIVAKYCVNKGGPKIAHFNIPRTGSISELTALSTFTFSARAV